jgi:hypothetical protein
MWGAVVFGFSVLSVAGMCGGLIVGMIVDMVGGILGIVWQPASSGSVSPVVQVIKEEEIIFKVRCSYCGSLYEETLDKCPYCGAHP